MFNQRRFLRTGNVKVNQRQVDVFQALGLAQQPAINFDLCPVQRTLVVCHVVQVTPVGFDFFQLVAVRVIAICTATHGQGFIVALKRDFILVTGVPPRCHHRMACHAFLRRRCRGKAQVQVTMFGSEFAQSADRDAVGQTVILKSICPLSQVACLCRT